MEEVEGKSPGAWGQKVEFHAVFKFSFLLYSSEVLLILKYRKIYYVYIGMVTDDFRDRNAVVTYC